MIRRTVTIAALADDDNGISVSQTPAAGDEQELTITGALATAGVATMPAAQRVTLTAAADETGRTFTVTGTNADGVVISEELAGPDTTTVTSTKYFKTVTSVTTDDDTAGAVIVGVLKADGAVSATIECDVNANGDDNKFLAEIAEVTESTGIAVEGTADKKDDVWTESVQEEGNWIAFTDLSSLSADTAKLLDRPAHSVRLKVAANVSGGVKLTIVERG